MAKIRKGFVSNSSSTSFIIVNKTNEKKTIEDFAEETLFLVDKFNSFYNYDYSHRQYLESAFQNYNEVWEPNESKVCSFGDEDGTVMGHILDYMLREKDASKSFDWEFFKYER